MNSKRFDWIVEKRLEAIKNTLVIKAKEYANDTDRLHNFNAAAIKSNQSREKALKGFMLKHEVSLDDIINNIDKGILPTRALLNEKMGDIINYYILLEASITDRINKVEEGKVNDGKR